MNLNNLNLAVILSAVLLISACDQKTSGNYEADLSTQIDSVSYAIGYQNGMLLDNEGLNDIDMENYLAGFNQALNSEEGIMGREELFAVINSYVQELSQRRGSENVEKGQAFLEENKDKEGVMVTESGLQYKVIEEGDGESPTAENVVSVHYEGTLIDGEVFDSSYDRGQPAEFPLNRVIPGWTEGVQLMREGATYEFYIPSELAYGAQAPQGSPIGPNETLIFKVELLEVKPAE
ncbi:MAG: FKBP-type peptidyl-prolyl cis-trans isomerase [Gracilimonas sp.]